MATPLTAIINSPIHGMVGNQNMVERYMLKAPFTDWIEVSQEEWIKAERNAGFRPRCAITDPRYMTECATGGFGSANIQGKIDAI